MIVPIILAGGSGVRLWPLSRRNYPKQMLSLIDKASLLQNTLIRVKTLPDILPPIVIGKKENRFILAEQVRKVEPNVTIMLESESRNTAPAVAIATLYVMSRAEDPILLVLPTDQYISDSMKFGEMIMKAAAFAAKGKLVTMGVTPSSPETGYGYIKKGKKLPKGSGYVVEQFVEKPSLDSAQSFMHSGEYFWNSGIFLFRASTLIKELEKYSPEILNVSQIAVKKLHITPDFIHLNAKLMQECPSVPLDKAVFENTSEAIVLPFPCDWLDLGDWKSLYKIGKKDNNVNVVNENVITFNTKNCYLYSNHQLLVTSGIKDCLVVVTTDAILVAHLNKKQDMKKIVEYLIAKKHQEAELSPEAYYPWGHYNVTEKTKDIQIRHFFINPGNGISFSKKSNCSTHWILARGRGKITRGKKTKPFVENESLSVASRAKYHLKNIKKTPMHLIEIQVRHKTKSNA
jgi:mannose-1-phosphate guanylyltransferase